MGGVIEGAAATGAIDNIGSASDVLFGKDSNQAALSLLLTINPVMD